MTLSAKRTWCGSRASPDRHPNGRRPWASVEPARVEPDRLQNFFHHSLRQTSSSRQYKNEAVSKTPFSGPKNPLYKDVSGEIRSTALPALRAPPGRVGNLLGQRKPRYKGQHVWIILNTAFELARYRDAFASEHQRNAARIPRCRSLSDAKKSEGGNEVEYFADYPRAKRRARSGRCSMGPGAFLVVEAAQ